MSHGVKMTPLLPMHTLGHSFIPEPIHAGGLRYHGVAPLISAAFSDPRPGAPVADLRVRIADRTPEQANEVLAAVGRKHMIVPGVLNRAFLLLQTRLMSRRRAVTAIGKFLEKGLDKPGR